MGIVTGLGIFSVICGILCILFGLQHKIFLYLAFPFFFITYYESGPEAFERKARFEQEAKERNNTTPTVIKEFDGCKMYGMMVEGSRKYVTRCENTTKTEWEYRSGKQTKTDETETISR